MHKYEFFEIFYYHLNTLKFIEYISLAIFEMQ
jgi:hypothetical protein